jgi:hypothetical protein
MKSSSEADPGVAPWRSRRWLAGFLLLGIIATCMDLYVLATLPLSIVAPFSGLTIVFSLALAGTGLISKREPLGRANLLACSVTLLGVTLVSTFGPREAESPPTGAQLLSDLLSPTFVLLLVVGYSAAALRMLVCRGRVPEQQQQAPMQGSVRTWALPALSAFGAACCACVAQLLVKLFATTLGSVLTGAAAFPATAPALLIELGGLIGNSVLHLTLLNITLAGSDVSLAVPLYQSLVLLVVSAAGGIIFHEFDSCPTLGLYFVGILTSLIGLALISYAAVRKAAREEALLLQRAQLLSDPAASGQSVPAPEPEDPEAAAASTAGTHSMRGAGAAVLAMVRLSRAAHHGHGHRAVVIPGLGFQHALLEARLSSGRLRQLDEIRSETLPHTAATRSAPVLPPLVEVEQARRGELER